jgi:predicted peroxiredoxin
MAKILAVGYHATDDPTLATLPFVTATGALGAGQEVSIVLIAEAAYLAKEAVANNVHAVGFPSLSKLIEKVVEAQVPVYV